MEDSGGRYATKTKSGKRVFTTPKDLQEVLTAKYHLEKDRRKDAFKRAIPFIGSEFDGIYALTQGLILVAAKSGNAKSTTAANILAHFLESDKVGRAIVISNEESLESIYNRIACGMAKLPFIQYHKGELSQEKCEFIESSAEAIIRSGRVLVVDDGEWDMTILEDVQAVLEFAAKQDVKLVIIDYLQTVNTSSQHPDWDSFRVSKELGFFLKNYGKRVTLPVVVFAQLKPQSESADIMSRFQNDRTIYNHAFDVIEVVPDFETRTTSFIIHKHRFGYAQGKTVTMYFNNGRYESPRRG